MPLNILVVEKAEAIAKSLRRNLDAKNYVVTCAGHRKALSVANRQKPDLIILDTRSVPPDRAQDVCKRLQKAKQGPTIALVYDRWPEEEMEGASYLKVGSGLDEISSRIEVVLRLREPTRGGAGNLSDGSVLSLAGLHLDLDRRTISRRSHQIHLTPKESKLLLAFMSNPGLVLTRGWLMREVWETDYPGDTRTLYVHVRWLREKIEEEPNTPHLLKTVRGVGYLFDPPVQAPASQ